MPDVREALSEIQSIRGHMARYTEFRGYGPLTLACTGVLAIVIAAAQRRWAIDLELEPARFLTMWIGAAAVALTLISLEAIARARRIHSSLAMQMLHAALEQFLPAIVAGILLTAVVARAAPQSVWMLPGLWQMLFSLGVFASCRFLPRATFWVGVWYLATGMACLAIGPDAAASPLEMGIPFGVGHLLVAGVLQFGYRRNNEES
ncbi:MAG TPA: hypothetical protein VHY36_10130 [Steroidobacteraceae bacterium]|jgi:hypothetical protein|nr:hypothetical protein [Steroidobacteraceae bacterium]